MDAIAVLLGTLIGLALGALAGWFLGVGRLSRQLQQHTVELSAGEIATIAGNGRVSR